MKKKVFVIIAVIASMHMYSQKVLQLEDCRQMALTHNKSVQMAQESVKAANELKKAAFTQFLPNFSANGAYTWNQKNLSLLSENAKLPTYSLTTGLMTGYTVLPKSALEYDIQNIFAGSIGFVQPIFMGGKIKELYHIAKYGENLAIAQQENKITELLLEVDEAYWRVVSLENKVKLAKEYRNLIAQVDSNVNVSIEEGVATKSEA